MLPGAVPSVSTPQIPDTQRHKPYARHQQHGVDHRSFFRIGDLSEGVTLEPGPQVWRSVERPSDIRDVRLNVTELAQVLELYRDKIYRCRLWQQPRLELTDELPNWIERFNEWEAA